MGLFIAGPIVLIWGFSSLFIGKQKAVERCGPICTSLAELGLRRFIPEIRNASEFDRFQRGLLANLDAWKSLYDVSVVQMDADTMKLNITNCPFCETFRKLGLPEFGPYVCQGDWEVAEANQDKWLFERDHQIGTGDAFCDHTYKRKAENPKTGT